MRAYLSPEELKTFYQFDQHRVIVNALTTWVLILGALGTWAVFGEWWLFVACFVVIAVQQNRLTTFVHEASHFNVVQRNKSLNDLISDMAFGAPILVSIGSYRRRHINHHQHQGVYGLDDEINDRYIIRGRGLVVNLAQCLVGMRAASAFFSHARAVQGPTEGASGSSGLRHWGLVGVVNLGLMIYCWAMGNVLAYPLLWLLPLGTLTTALITLRVIGEHQSEGYARRGEENFSASLAVTVTRTIPAGFIERAAFGPLNFCYHNEHHLFPGVPYAQLPQLHRLLQERGYYNDHPECFAPSYAAVLWSRIRGPAPDRAAAPQQPQKI